MAVYTEVSDEELNALLADYDIGRALSCKGIAEGVENSNYLLQTEVGRYILTLYEKRVSEHDLPFFLSLMEHLSDRGIDCPVPVHGRDGAALRQVAGRPAAIVSFLEGVCAKRPKREHCARLGESLARMHLAGEGFEGKRPNALNLAGWHALYEQCASKVDQVEDGLGETISKELDYLDAHWPQNLRQGIIHADLFPDNVFFIQDRLSGLIDFYFACNDALIYDLAVCINAWCFEPHGEFNATKARTLSRAYMSISQLPAEDVTALPILCRGAALRFLLTRLFDWLNAVDGALVKQKDPLEYVQRLRFHQSAVSAESYGLG